MLLERCAHRLVWAVALAAVIVCVRLIPSPSPASAGVCDVPVVSTVCSVVGSVASGLYDGTKWTVDLGSGAVKLGGKVVGTVISKGGDFICNTVGDGWTAKACNWIANKVGGSVSNKVSGSGSSSASGPGGGLPGTTQAQALEPADSPQSYLRTSAIAAGAAFFAGEIAHVVSRGTSADLTAPWYQQLYGRVAGFAVGVALLALLLALAEGATLGDGALVAAALRAVPYAALMTAAATSLVMLALQIVDAASWDIAGPNMHEVTHVLHVAAALFVGLGLVAKASTVAAAHGGALAHLGMIAKLAAFPAAMFAIFGAIATAAVAAELVLREVAIYASVLFLPLILAARIWPRLRHAGERLGRALGAVIVSKLVLVLVLAMLAAAILDGGLSGLVMGIAGLFAVALAPAMFYRLFVLAEHGFTRGALPVPQPMSAADRMADVVGWHTARVNEVRGAAYAPVVAAAGTAGPPPAPPPPPPAARAAPPPVSTGGGESAPRPAQEVSDGDE